MATATETTRLLKIEELRAHVPFSVRKLQSLYRDHGMPHIRCGRQVLFDAAEVVQWLREQGAQGGGSTGADSSRR